MISASHAMPPRVRSPLALQLPPDLISRIRAAAVALGQTINEKSSELIVVSSDLPLEQPRQLRILDKGVLGVSCLVLLPNLQCAYSFSRRRYFSQSPRGRLQLTLVGQMHQGATIIAALVSTTAMEVAAVTGQVEEVGAIHQRHNPPVLRSKFNGFQSRYTKLVRQVQRPSGVHQVSLPSAKDLQN